MAQKVAKKTTKKYHRREKLALIIPAHNEELVIADTIQSAIAAGQPKQQIYVVDDASKDKTSKIAKKILGASNVIKVPHSGKLGAIQKAFDCFNIAERYQWVHIADADGAFGETYFSTMTRALNSRYAAATGHVQSLPGSYIGAFRVYEYTIGLEIVRRLQNWMGTITVIPGPTSIFRTDVFAKLDADTGSLTEDFDMTLQLYRKKLGKIMYVPAAKAYTQDPLTYHDYVKQISRWYRGYFQGIRRHRIGLKPSRIDAYILLTCLQTWWYAATLLLLAPIAILSHHPLTYLSLYFVYDFAFFFLWIIFVAIWNWRFDVIEAFPFFYILRFTNVIVFVKSGIEVFFTKKFTNLKSVWESPERYRSRA